MPGQSPDTRFPLPLSGLGQKDGKGEALMPEGRLTAGSELQLKKSPGPATERLGPGVAEESQAGGSQQATSCVKMQKDNVKLPPDSSAGRTKTRTLLPTLVSSYLKWECNLTMCVKTP